MNPAQRLAVAASRWKDWCAGPGFRQDVRFECLPYLPLLVLPLLVSSLTGAIGRIPSVCLGALAALVAISVLPQYGQRLREPARAADRVAACQEVLSALSGRLSPERRADTERLLRKGRADAGLKVILRELVAAGTTLDEPDSTQLSLHCARIGVDEESRGLLVDLGVAPDLGPPPAP